MGLDMYLNAHKYVGNWEHDSSEKRSVYRQITSSLGLDGFSCDGSPHLTVQVCVAYWRKVNAVHKWFVGHCQDGVDECQESSVSREQVQELLDLCQKVQAEHNPELLPPCEGILLWRDGDRPMVLGGD